MSLYGVQRYTLFWAAAESRFNGCHRFSQLQLCLFSPLTFSANSPETHQSQQKYSWIDRVKAFFLWDQETGFKQKWERGLFKMIPVKYKISCHPNKHHLLISSMGRLSSADYFHWPSVSTLRWANPRVMGGFSPLWEEVTRLSSAKSDSVIKPKGLGGSIWFPGTAEGSLVGCGRLKVQHL